jgi:hypothetical protein
MSGRYPHCSFVLPGKLAMGAVLFGMHLTCAPVSSIRLQVRDLQVPRRTVATYASSSCNPVILKRTSKGEPVTCSISSILMMDYLEHPR